MLKKERSKEMSGEERTSKNKAQKIRCTRECEMPWIGSFQVGEEITDQGKIAAIGDNPNFEIVAEEA
jgi:hypothetical protein